ncbi:LPXTG cell wall anchor domain-containing protein [Bacillus sp. DJP31]
MPKTGAGGFTGLLMTSLPILVLAAGAAFFLFKRKNQFQS